MTKNREEEIIEYFKGTLFYKDLEDYEVKTVLNIINTYKDQKREVLILKIAELVIKNDKDFKHFISKCYHLMNGNKDE